MTAFAVGDPRQDEPGVTERTSYQGADEALRLQAALLDNIPGCLALILRKGSREIVASNRLAREAGAMPGRTCYSTCNLRDDPCPYCLAPTLWETGQTQRLEVKYQGRWTECIWTPLSDDTYVHYMFDIQERKRTEETLRERDERLQRSQQLDVVGQLAGGMAHDFNNLLTTVIGYSDLLLNTEGSISPAAMQDLKEIKRAADRATALVRQILAFSRRQALQPTLVTLDTLVASMEPLLRHTLGEDIGLVTLSDPDLGPAEIDVHQFQQVVINLALNARDAMPAGGRLTLETRNADLSEAFFAAHPEVTPGSYVLLAVTDTGVGMDEALKSRIFEPFFTTKPPGSGTGLGLSSVYGIVHQSGGFMEVDSTPGEGSSFRIYLPRAATMATVTSPASGLDEPSLPVRETVLVVEDEQSLRALTSRVLTRAGYLVLTAATASDALEILRESREPIDLLLTDVVLPGELQGDDLVRAVSASRPDLPVLYMSGYDRGAVMNNDRLGEEVNYLEKPFLPETLVRTVRDVMDLAHAGRGAGPASSL